MLSKSGLFHKYNSVLSINIYSQSTKTEHAECVSTQEKVFATKRYYGHSSNSTNDTLKMVGSAMCNPVRPGKYMYNVCYERNL